MPRPAFPVAKPFSDQPRPPIALNPVPSNQIESIGYDSSTSTLAVRFRRGTGAIYHYPGVLAATYDAFVEAESKGQFFDKNIKPLAFEKFPAEPVADAEQQG